MADARIKDTKILHELLRISYEAAKKDKNINTGEEFIEKVIEHFNKLADTTYPILTFEEIEKAREEAQKLAEQDSGS